MSKSNKVNCQLQSNCLIKNVVYKVYVKRYVSDDTNKNNDFNKNKISGSTGGHFKDRWYTGHKCTFKRINKKKSTRLSEFVWQYFDRYGTKQEMELSTFHYANNNIGGVSKICQICNL